VASPRPALASRPAALRIHQPPEPPDGGDDLDALAKRINAAQQAIEAGERKGLPYYRAAGEALNKAKAEVIRRNGGKKRGERGWEEWLTKNCPRVGRVQAWRYREFAKCFVTKPSMTEEEQWVAWRAISGNVPAKRPRPGDGRKKRAAERDPTKRGESAPKTHVLSTRSGEEFREFLGLLHRAGKAFATGDDDFATILVALRRCEKAGWLASTVAPRGKGAARE
jgi:hypothetical protein